ncbi:MAG: hypothetical protein JO251_21870 [Verrucomicrobia bacterium]|nr:hypothetical protein [Verrucomicrobiota bacterium]
MKANGLMRSARRTPVSGRKISWAQVYDRRMRRFNLEVVLAASIFLAIVITWWILYP